jgi:LisH domain-containing protein ARMC9
LTLLGELFQSFDNGKTKDFFRAWHELVPSYLIHQDFSALKLEFYLRIYFVIFAHHPSIRSIKDHAKCGLEQAEFKKYLDSAGPLLSRNSEFLAYYALPYVPDPMEHPQFKSLFTPQWLSQLESQLKAFINDKAPLLGLPP